MAVIRTIAWIALVCGLLIFSFYNWRPVEVTIWENLVLETKVPVALVLAFLIGFVPLLAYHLSVKWSLKRRVRSLENSLKTLATARRNDAPGSSDGTLIPVNAPASEAKKQASDEDTFDAGAEDGGGGDGGGGGD